MLRCSRMPGCPLPQPRRWLGSVRRHRPKHLSDTPCRTAHGNESWAIPSLWHATPSAISEHWMELLGSSPIPRSFVASCVRLLTEALSIESSDSFVASAAASIATGWSEPVPGRELHPLKSSAFHGARFHQLTARYSIGSSNSHFAQA